MPLLRSTSVSHNILVTWLIDNLNTVAVSRLCWRVFMRWQHSEYVVNGYLQLVVEQGVVNARIFQLFLTANMAAHMAALVRRHCFWGLRFLLLFFLRIALTRPSVDLELGFWVFAYVRVARHQTGLHYWHMLLFSNGSLIDELFFPDQLLDCVTVGRIMIVLIFGSFFQDGSVFVMHGCAYFACQVWLDEPVFFLDAGELNLKIDFEHVLVGILHLTMSLRNLGQHCTSWAAWRLFPSRRGPCRLRSVRDSCFS